MNMILRGKFNVERLYQFKYKNKYYKKKKWCLMTPLIYLILQIKMTRRYLEDVSMDCKIISKLLKLKGMWRSNRSIIWKNGEPIKMQNLLKEFNEDLDNVKFIIPEGLFKVSWNTAQYFYRCSCY